MAQYRIQILNDGLIAHVIPFEAPDDADARRFATAQRYGKPTELRCGNRLVNRYIARLQED